MIGMQEVDCSKGKSLCDPVVLESHWGNLFMQSTSEWLDSVAISNGTRYGLFVFELFGFDTTSCAYDFASFTSDMSIAWLLFQWMLSMIAVQRGFFKRVSGWHNTDIGCLANTYSFGVLPITSLPRAKMIIAAFSSVGCSFEGSQKALGDSWFVIYPSIVILVLVYSSLINIIAKIFRRRVICWQIPVVIAFLSILHWLRNTFAACHSFGNDGRAATLVSPEEFEAMSLLELFEPTTFLRLNGNVKPLIIIKILVLCLNALPLLLSQDMSLSSKHSQDHTSAPVRRYYIFEHAMSAVLSGLDYTNGATPTPGQDSW